jgi:hypothetical protein
MNEEELRAAWVTEPPRLTGRIQVVDYDPAWPGRFKGGGADPGGAGRAGAPARAHRVDLGAGPGRQADHRHPAGRPRLLGRAGLPPRPGGGRVHAGHPGDRASYQRAKRELAERDWTYVQEYADAKTEVIEGIIARARESADGG